MSIGLISKIKPLNNGAFPVFEDVDSLGGFQVRNDITDRNNIPALNRKEGMIVYVKIDGKFYQLVGGTSNSNWVIANFNSGSYIPYPSTITSNYTINASDPYNFYNLNTTQTPINISNTTGNGISPIVITTSSPHGLLTNNIIQISGVLGNTNANGNYTITYIDSTNFSLNISSGNGNYISGGNFIKMETSLTITLPLANSVTVGRFYTFKDISGKFIEKSVSIIISGSDTIDITNNSILLDKEYQSITLVSNGVNGWNILNNQYNESKIIYTSDDFIIPATTQKYTIFCDTVYGERNIKLPNANSRDFGTMNIIIKSIRLTDTNINIITFGNDSIEGVSSNYTNPYKIEAIGGVINLTNSNYHSWFLI